MEFNFKRVGLIAKTSSVSDLPSLSPLFLPLFSLHLIRAASSVGGLFQWKTLKSKRSRLTMTPLTRVIQESSIDSLFLFTSSWRIVASFHLRCNVIVNETRIIEGGKKIFDGIFPCFFPTITMRKYFPHFPKQPTPSSLIVAYILKRNYDNLFFLSHEE